MAARRRLVAVVAVAALVAVLAMAAAPPAGAGGATRQVDVTPDGSDSGHYLWAIASGPDVAVSDDGRLVAFVAPAPNLVAGDDNGVEDAFVRDVVAGVTTLVSDVPGVPPHTGVEGVAMSADGRYVAYTAVVSEWPHVFRLDRATGVTERVTVDANGDPAVYGGEVESMSDDGRFVAFRSRSYDLAPGDQESGMDLFVRDMARTRTVLAGVGPDPDRPGSAAIGRLSATGRYVAFTGGGFTVGIPNRSEVFWRDLVTGTTVRVSSALDGGPAASDSYSPSISDDGRFVAFVSDAGNLVTGDPTNHLADVFVRDVRAGTTVAVGVGHDGQPANGGWNPTISDDGRFVAFASPAANLVPGDDNGQQDVFVRDLRLGTNAMASTGPGGEPGNGPSGQPVLAGAAGAVVFISQATNLVPGHEEPVSHLYHRRLR